MIVVNNRTDLALESYESAEKTKLEGVIVKELGDVTSVEIINKDGAEALGKPIGKYITYTMPELQSGDVLGESLAKSATLLSSLLPDPISSVLVAGVGNLSITADALGPKSSRYVLATRHIINDSNINVSDSFFDVSVITTGVLGDTGIESAEIIKGVAKELKPSCVIAVDALAASSSERLGRTLQLSDTGIIPGSGVGNHRHEISEKTLGVPVISLGIPTVISASAMGSGESSLYVTPREIDKLISNGAKLIGMAVNVCLQKSFTAEELFSLVG